MLTFIGGLIMKFAELIGKLLHMGEYESLFTAIIIIAFVVAGIIYAITEIFKK